MADYICWRTIRMTNAAIGRHRFPSPLVDEDWDCCYDSMAMTDEYAGLAYSRKEPNERSF